MDSLNGHDFKEVHCFCIVFHLNIVNIFLDEKIKKALLVQQGFPFPP
jgi:hypothetical protein